jgi:hypothetical protein
MTQQIINVGNTPNNGQGETLRSGATKINENFSELYGLIGAGGDQTFVNTVAGGTGISVNASNGNVIITNTLPYIRSFTAVAVNGQTTLSSSGNQTLTMVAGSNVTLTTNAVTGALTITATQQQADWNAVSGPTAIVNKPSIPAAQIQSDWNQSNNTHVDYIKNKPTIPTDVNQLADSTGLLPDGFRFNAQSSTLAPSATGVIYTAILNPTAIKATIRVAGTITGSTIDSEVCEMVITRTYPTTGNPQVYKTVYSVTSTTGSALATFDVQWNATSSAIEITGTNLNSGPSSTLATKVVSLEVLP